MVGWGYHEVFTPDKSQTIVMKVGLAKLFRNAAGPEWIRGVLVSAT